MKNKKIIILINPRIKIKIEKINLYVIEQKLVNVVHFNQMLFLKISTIVSKT